MELLDRCKELKALDPAVHWFCKRNESRPKNPDSDADASWRAKMVFDSLMIFSFDGEKTDGPKKDIKEGTTRNLLRCEHCIAGYYRGLSRNFQGLREE